MQAKNNSYHSTWIPTIQSNNHAGIRLFCFPYAGGSSSIYFDWHKYLSPFVEVYPIQLPGRGGRLREAPFTDLFSLVEKLSHVLTPMTEGRPFAFFGHSMGALIAFELARLFADKNHAPPLHLFISGRRAPQWTQEENTKCKCNLSDAELISELKRLDGTPAEFTNSQELMELMLPTLRADFHVCDTYIYKTDVPLTTPITVFGGSDDSDIPKESLTPWKEHTTSDFDLHILQGNHFFLNTSKSNLLQLLTLKLKNKCGV